MLKFGHIGENYDNYDYRDFFQFVSYDVLRRETHSVANNNAQTENSNTPYTMCISTCLTSTFWSLGKGKRWLKKPVFIMTLDCDSEENAGLIARCLERMRIDYARVPTGTNGHYWFFCNKIDTINKLLPIMEECDGCDRNYIQYCRENESIHVRAFPKNGIVPAISSIGLEPNNDIRVVIHDSGSKSISRFKKLCAWLKEFRIFWLTYSEGNENHFVVTSQIQRIERERLSIIERDSVIVQEPSVSVDNNDPYFDYGSKEKFNPIDNIDLKESKVEVKEEVEYHPINGLEL